jgi:23S rRNA pseudouridine955/2504/2580 synthase
VHGQALGHPVAGDHEYGDADANRLARGLGLRRMFLHAQALRFADWRGEEQVFSAPLPAELQQVLETLAGDAK